MSKFFESLLETGHTVIALDVSDLDSTLLHLRSLSRSTGRSFYYWSENNGLHSMKDSEITVPGCSKLIDALRHVANSLHYGIYIFSGFDKQLTHNANQALISIAKNPNEAKHCVILIGEKLNLPGMLKSSIHQVAYHEQDQPKLQLRDGRWVVS